MVYQALDCYSPRLDLFYARGGSMLNRILSLFLVMSLSFFAACGGGEEQEKEAPKPAPKEAPTRAGPAAKASTYHQLTTKEIDQFYTLFQGATPTQQTAILELFTSVSQLCG